MEISEKKTFDYSNKNEQTCFLINKFIDLTNKKNVLFNLPDSMCFSFGLKEIITICEISEEVNNRSYFYLANSFYEFLKSDYIFKKIDNFGYLNLLRQLKLIVDDYKKINISETKNLMKKTLKIYNKKYINELQKELERIIDGHNINYDDLDFISNTFVNELLSMGYTYKYLNYIFNYFFHQNNTTGVFTDLKDLIRFLSNKMEDRFEMYLPLKNISERDIQFIENQFLEQKIIKGNELYNNDFGFNVDEEKYYCHIYFNSNDYFKSTEEQLNRVNSIFNILKFYTNSQISLDFEAKPFIYSKKLGEISRYSIKTMLQYSYFEGTTSVIEKVNETFDNLNKNHNNILLDIYDIMNYSQKNHDILSNDQFLSKWISIESCASKASNKKGFDAVLKYVTKALSISFYRQKITRILKNSLSNCKLETFILKYDSNSFYNRVKKIKNNYYQYEINKYIDILSSNSKLYKSFCYYQRQLEYMIYRIYIMRNKYVHSGYTINNNDMLRYYLNIIEPFFLDKVIKTMNTLLGGIVEYDKITWEDIFSEIDFKYDSLYNTLLLMNEPLKISTTTSIKLNDIVDNNTRKYLIVNFLVEHSKNMNEMKGIIDYSDIEEDDEIIIE